MTLLISERNDIFRKHYLNPVVVNNPNILYVMNNDDDVIIKYNIKTKQLES